MKVNDVIKELKKIKNEYGNVEVTIFDWTAWDNCRDDDCGPLAEISYEEYNKRIVLF